MDLRHSALDAQQSGYSETQPHAEEQHADAEEYEEGAWEEAAGWDEWGEHAEEGEEYAEGEQDPQMEEPAEAEVELREEAIVEDITSPVCVEQPNQVMRMKLFTQEKRILQLQQKLEEYEKQPPSTAGNEKLSTENSRLKELCTIATLSWQFKAEQAERDRDAAHILLRQQAAELKAEAQARESDLLRELTTLQQLHSAATKELEALHASNVSLQRTTESLKLQLETKESELQEAQSQLWMKCDDIVALQHQKEELEESRLKAKYEAHTLQLEGRYHQRLADQHRTIEALRQEIHEREARQDLSLTAEEVPFLPPGKGSYHRILHDSTQPESIASLEYLKQVVLHFLCTHDSHVRCQLLPVLKTTLNFSTTEMNSILIANPQWAGHRDPCARLMGYVSLVFASPW
eukprot:NODE_2014_length_1305_cov_30.901528_g1917_i0.p1 GENE.NODE_2014_length_1305_cov_30.901528_g1917_i0~~NODE_2014_length_1305_cov_30.901528_g1917_i0.p1  ORF type:complete len:405 (+),score=116.02 NODE_2014_length_1305_cov_30.901528_g1917_i0:58-1272(+)